MQILRLAPVALMAVTGLAGCARTYNVKVDAIHNPEIVGGTSYKIVSKQPGLEERDPNYAQAVSLVKNALSGRGMYEAPNPKDAEVVVEVDYGIGPARTKIETEHTPSTMMHDPLTQLGVQRRGVDPLATVPGSMPGTPGSGTVILPDGRVARPMVDEEEEIRTSEVYDKHLSIAAREATPPSSTKRGRELWRVDVSIEDEKVDIAEVLPVMAGAAVDYIGANTGNRQTVRVSEDGEQVTFVKGGP